MTRLAEARMPNVKLIRLREGAGLSQEELANRLNKVAASMPLERAVYLTKKTIGRWERGEVEWPQPFHRRLLAEFFHVAVDELRFRRPLPAHGTITCRPRGTTELLNLVTGSDQQDLRVADNQHQWREVRRALDGCRHELAVLAEQLYPDFHLSGLEGTGAISVPAWIPAAPIPLEKLVLDQVDDAPVPTVTGVERESAAVRPLATVESRYRRYSHAVRDLAAPGLFENRLCFRLIEVDWSRPAAQLSFGSMCFFDSIDTNEVLAHEIALQHLVRSTHGEVVTSTPSWRRLPFRKLVGDPFDLGRRPLMGAVGTLTVRGGESPSVVLHQRDGRRVSGGGGMAHLLPAGVFQPSSVLPEAVANDFSLWRNIQREYAEEVLGFDEYD